PKNPPFRQPPDGGPPLLQEPLDLTLLAPLQRVRVPAPTPGWADDGRVELNVPDPQRHAALGDPDSGGDLGQGQAGPPQLAGLPAFDQLARYPMGASFRNDPTGRAMHPQ